MYGHAYEAEKAGGGTGTGSLINFDMRYEFLKKPVKTLVSLLASKQYDEIARLTKGNRLDAKSIETAVEDYGRDLTIPPESVFDKLDVVEVQGANPPRWSIRCRLWTIQEGESDLSLEVTAIGHDDKFQIELDDIHVL